MKDLSNFQYSHLPENLQLASKPFHDLAELILSPFYASYGQKSKEEMDACLRKLLEAKDCAVRLKLMQIEQDDELPY